jgi:coatomer subunit zeta
LHFNSAAMNLSLYTVTGFVITDTDGHRVLAKYYHPPGNPNPSTRKLTSLKDQRAFEKGLFQKTKKAGGSHSSVFPLLTGID